jgi:ABC-type amino acid transport system permease subunit
MTGILTDLLLGFPNRRPGGLLLTIGTAILAGVGALALGLVYAAVCVRAPRASLILQSALAVLRGVPLILLLFFLAQTTPFPLSIVGVLALLTYSLCHVGEILRAYLAAYPRECRDMARLLRIGPVAELLHLRLQWTVRQSFDAVATHWVSLLKDTGALTVIGVGELTTVAHVLGERASFEAWWSVLLQAAAMYLLAVLVLMRLCAIARRRLSLEGARE